MPFESILLSQGPLGIVAAILFWLLLAERKKSRRESQDRIMTLELHHKELDAIRLTQIDREKVFSKTLEEYGHRVLSALEKLNFLSEELRRIYDENRRS